MGSEGCQLLASFASDDLAMRNSALAVFVREDPTDPIGEERCPFLHWRIGLRASQPKSALVE
eukprot:12896603-Prorocentrum_lima.AAC.1